MALILVPSLLNRQFQNRYPGGDIDSPVNYCIASFPDNQEISLVIDPTMRLYELFEGERRRSLSKYSSL